MLIANTDVYLCQCFCQRRHSSFVSHCIRRRWRQLKSRLSNPSSRVSGRKRWLLLVSNDSFGAFLRVWCGSWEKKWLKAQKFRKVNADCYLDVDWRAGKDTRELSYDNRYRFLCALVLVDEDESLDVIKGLWTRCSRQGAGGQKSVSPPWVWGNICTNRLQTCWNCHDARTWFSFFNPLQETMRRWKQTGMEDNFQCLTWECEWAEIRLHTDIPPGINLEPWNTRLRLRSLPFSPLPWLLPSNLCTRERTREKV